MPRPSKHIYALLVLSASIAIFGASSFQRAQVVPKQRIENPVEIGIEHNEPLSVSIEASEMKGKGLLEIEQSGAEEILLSLPSDWIRKEVRNASIKDVTFETASLGFKRWHMPAGASILFELPKFPSSLIIHNPSKVTVKVSLTKVDMESGLVENEVVLVQEGPVKLW